MGVESVLQTVDHANNELDEKDDMEAEDYLPYRDNTLVETVIDDKVDENQVVPYSEHGKPT
jgi:hypothetical protein